MLPTRACTEAAEEVGHYIHAECTHSRVQPAPPPDPLTFEDHRLCSGRQKNAAGSDVSAIVLGTTPASFLSQGLVGGRQQHV